MPGLTIAPEVQAAIDAGQPLVALETAVLTHGLPRESGLDAMRRQMGAVREVGATPAVVAVFSGRLLVGLSESECETLAREGTAVKVSPWNLASAQLTHGFGGTTVAATLVAATLARIAVLSTGGIGGIHRGGVGDVSADLTELGRRAVCVVCAGPKSILNPSATLERLETLGVPVIGWRSQELAGFLTPTTGLLLPARVDGVDALVDLLRTHWALGGGGVVVSQPLPDELAVPLEQLAPALKELDGEGERGAGRTPAELARLRSRIGDRALEANLALLERNARLAARIAAALPR